MASIACPRLPSPSFSVHADPSSAKFPATPAISLSHYPCRAFLLLQKTAAGVSRAPPAPFLCRCHKPSPSGEQGDGSSPEDSSAPRSWDSLVQDVISGAAKRWDELLTAWQNSWSKNGLAAVTAAAVEKEAGEEKKVSGVEVNEEDGGEWDWERWNRHFVKVEEQEKLISALKSQLNDAVSKEDYEHAVKLKLAIAGTTENDVVGTALSIMNRAIEEERYSDAAFIRDHAGAGLVGWWAGISEDGADPYGRIICVSAEYGRYVARSYSPRQLATGRPGFPLFEVFYTKTNGEYKQQVVCLKQHERSGDLTESEKGAGFSNLNLFDDLKGENSLQNQDIKTIEGRDDDSNITDGISIIQDVLRDLIPGVKFRVLKLVSPGKVDRDAIAKVVEQIMEEEEEGSEEDGSDEEFESIESEDLSGEDDAEEMEMEAGDSTNTNDGKSEVSLKVVISGLTPKLPADVLPTNLVRIPASLEKRDRLSFSIILGQDAFRCAIDEKRQALEKKAVARKSADLLSFELAKLIPDKNKIHLKVLKDLQELINYSVNGKQNYHSLFEATLFSRIELPLTSDPLSGLYIGSYGIYNSNVLHLKHKFGQWQEDHMHQKHMDLEFYEYVEAIKLTGDPSVPAGQVAFRAKVGKQHQLPHKGIIPEEFGVIARYKGQGRLADPGYRNPRWVDGELVIFDGKYIRGGPVIGFVYWAPESHFLLFFNRLRLPA